MHENRLLNAKIHSARRLWATSWMKDQLRRHNRDRELMFSDETRNMKLLEHYLPNSDDDYKFNLKTTWVTNQFQMDKISLYFVHWSLLNDRSRGLMTVHDTSEAVQSSEEEEDLKRFSKRLKFTLIQENRKSYKSWMSISYYIYHWISQWSFLWSSGQNSSTVPCFHRHPQRQSFSFYRLISHALIKLQIAQELYLLIMFSHVLSRFPKFQYTSFTHSYTNDEYSHSRLSFSLSFPSLSSSRILHFIIFNSLFLFSSMFLPALF